MEVFITGGSGFIGHALSQGLTEQGHGVTVLSRSAQGAGRLPVGVGTCLGDPTRPGAWQEEAARHQAFINLAGASIFERWNEPYKRLMLDSRVLSTRHLVEAIAKRPAGQPAVLISASAVGYYGFHGDEELDETAPPGDDFLAQVCRQWEEEARKAEEASARVVRARFGIVLGARGGALAKMLPLFRLGLGGPLGGGGQWFSWVHQHDMVQAVLFCLADQSLNGPVNCTAPQPVSNRELSRALGRALGRPAWLPAPSLAVRLALGEFASVVLRGQRVVPRVLGAQGFRFAFPTIDEALAGLPGLG